MEFKKYQENVRKNMKKYTYSQFVKQSVNEAYGELQF